MEKAEIHYLTKSKFKEIVNQNLYVDNVHLLDNNFSSVVNVLKKESFDYIIDLHKNARSLRIKSSLKRMSFSLNKLNFKKWLLVNFKVNKLPKLHIVDRYFETLKMFDIENDQKGLDYFYEEPELIEFEKFRFMESQFISFVIGAQHATKRLPNEKIIEICDLLELPVILVGDKNDFLNGEIIANRAKNNVYNACGKLKLNESVHLLKHSDLVITHDTGLMHIAAALNKKIISVWGNTIPDFGMYPYMPGKQEHFTIVEVRKLKCRPCSKIGYNNCPKKHFNCMNEIDINAIAEKAKLYLRTGRSGQ
ncbi:glycosyltransferase family 9 protein [Bacteroidota bacterium]